MILVLRPLADAVIEKVASTAAWSEQLSDQLSLILISENEFFEKLILSIVEKMSVPGLLQVKPFLRDHESAMFEVLSRLVTKEATFSFLGRVSSIFCLTFL